MKGKKLIVFSVISIVVALLCCIFLFIPLVDEIHFIKEMIIVTKDPFNVIVNFLSIIVLLGFIVWNSFFIYWTVKPSRSPFSSGEYAEQRKAELRAKKKAKLEAKQKEIADRLNKM